MPTRPPPTNVYPLRFLNSGSGSRAKRLAVDRLRACLQRIDGRGYPAYNKVRGHYEWAQGVLHVELRDERVTP